MGRASRRKRERGQQALESVEAREFRQVMDGPDLPVGIQARSSGPAMLIEPEFEGGAVPHYRPCLDHLLKEHAAEIEAGIERGAKFEFHIRHDSWCPALTAGGCCTCDCVVDLVWEK